MEVSSMFNYKRWTGLALTLVLFMSGIFSTAFADPPAAPAGYKWTQTLNEPFDGTTINTKLWDHLLPWKHRKNLGTGEIQGYRQENAIVTGGTLQILGKREQFNGNDGNIYSYTSDMLQTFDKFSQQYGYFEAKIKYPSGQGLWPAWWLLPNVKNPDGSWKWPPEIDILEALGKDPKTAYMTLHYTNSAGQADWDQGKYDKGGDLSQGYHTYAVNWQKGRIDWYIDGVLRYTQTQNIPTDPMYLVLNLAMGGNWAGAPNNTTPFPAIMYVDEVKVWKLEQGTTTPPTNPPTNPPTTPTKFNVNCSGTIDINVKQFNIPCTVN